MTYNPNTPDKDGTTPIYLAAQVGHTEIVKILAPLTNNPNASNRYQETPIYCAAYKGHTEIVKILTPLIDNPNAANGNTPILWAAFRGDTEIVKLLVPLTDNPNAPNQIGITPSSVAKNAEVRKLLKSSNNSRKRKARPSLKEAKKF